MEPFTRKAAKAAVLPFGVPNRRRAGDVAILLYHRVGAGTREIDLDTRSFERQMAYLASRGDARTLDAALEPRRPGGVVVTVDDGYSDFYENVLPVLIAYRVPAVLYLATALVADGEGSRAGDDGLTWSQLQEAVSTGLVTVGSHTHTHADLARASGREAEDEMRRSRELIEDRLSVPCSHFAYPWSLASAEAEAVARRLFDTAALLWGTNREGSIDPHRLGRTPVLRSDGPVFFRAKVEGMLDREALLYRVARRGPWRRA